MSFILSIFMRDQTEISGDHDAPTQVVTVYGLMGLTSLSSIQGNSIKNGMVVNLPAYWVSVQPSFILMTSCSESRPAYA